MSIICVNFKFDDDYDKYDEEDNDDGSDEHYDYNNYCNDKCYDDKDMEGKKC